LSPAEPAWLLLAWAGLIASAVAALAGAPPGATTLLDRPRDYRRRRAASFVRAVLLSALVGVVLYPIAYGLIFEAAGRADLPLGAGIGAAHAILALLVRALRRIPGPHAAPLFRLVLARLAYGAVIGFLYVVPPTFS
jgi:hypothetical protein